MKGERRGRGRGRREEEEEEAKQAKVWNFGFLVWKLTLIMNSMRFGMDLWVCMMIFLLKLSRPDSGSDPIGGSEPSSECETQDWDSLLDFFF